MANSADPDQTAPEEQFDQGLHSLLRYSVPIFSKFQVYFMNEFNH